MRIAVHSDLHNEKRESNVVITTPADVIVLAGDNHTGIKAFDFACEVADTNPQAQVLWIAGNHEYYGSELHCLRQVFRETNGQHARVTFLENSTKVIDDVEFIGATLWTDFSVLAAGNGRNLAWHCHAAENSIADFYFIQDAWHGKLRNANRPTITSSGMITYFQESVHFIQQRLMDSAVQQKIVVTHFAPTRKTQHHAYLGQSLGAYFNVAVDSLLELRPTAWIYGHTHCNHTRNIRIQGVPVYCNQGCYPGEYRTQQESGYHPDYCFELIE